MKRNILLGSTILLAGVLTGCSKTEELISEEVTENIKEEDNLSANLDLARTEYIENEKPLYINNLLYIK